MFITSAFLFKFLLGAELVTVFSSITDPEWAAPINTALLVALTVLARWNGKKIHVTQEMVHETAKCASAAAEASAAAARIAKDIGGKVRYANERGTERE